MTCSETSITSARAWPIACAEVTRHSHPTDSIRVWRELAAATVVYIDLGVTKGMQYGIDHCLAAGRDPEYRRLGGEWASPDQRMLLL